MLVEEVELAVGMLLVGRQARRRRAAGVQRLLDLVGDGAGMLVWMPGSSGGACTAICSVTASPQSPPCATKRV